MSKKRRICSQCLYCHSAEAVEVVCDVRYLKLLAHVCHTQLLKCGLQVADYGVEMLNTQALFVVQPPMCDGRVLAHVVVSTAKCIRQKLYLHSACCTQSL